MEIHDIVIVDDNHIRIVATPDASALSDEITSVKVDNQTTFVCSNEASPIASSLSIPSGESSFINVDLDTEYTPLILKKDLLFFFLTNTKVIAHPENYILWEYKQNESEGEELSYEWTVVQSISGEPDKVLYDVDYNNPNIDKSEWGTIVGTTVKVIQKEVLDEELIVKVKYDEPTLYKLVYKSLVSLTIDKNCCDDTYTFEGKLVILLKAFELANTLLSYREMIKLWDELHKIKSSNNHSCNCHA